MSHSTLPPQNENHAGRDVITKYFYNTYFLPSAMTLWVGIPSMGIVCNIISIRTFVSLGLRDSVSISLFYQSISDLGIVVSALIQGVASILRLWESSYGNTFLLEPFAFIAIFANVRQCFYSMSVLTTTFLALARSMCVYMPLKFKGAFTVRKTEVILLVFTVFAILNHGPTLNLSFEHAGQNNSRLITILDEKYKVATDIELIVSDMVLSLATELIAIICLLVLINSLQISAKRRYEMTRGGQAPDDTDAISPGETSAKGTSLSRKELQVVQQVALLSVIYIICNMPNIVAALLRPLLPEFHLRGALRYAYSVAAVLRVLFDSLNSSINFFVYYKYNSNFRSSLYCNGCRGKAVDTTN